MNNTIWLQLVAAITPALILAGYILIRDRKQPEPFLQILKGFGYGMLSTLCIIVLALVCPIQFDETTFGGCLASAFIEAAIPEEAFKLLFLWLLLRHNPHFDEHMDGIVYAVCIGMGFAAFENVLYILPNASWQSVSISRAFLSIPGHYLNAVAMGFFYALFHFSSGNKRWWFLLLAYICPVLLHGIYDTICFSAGAGILSVVALLVFLAAFIFSVFCTNKVVRTMLYKDNEWSNN